VWFVASWAFDVVVSWLPNPTSGASASASAWRWLWPRRQEVPPTPRRRLEEAVEEAGAAAAAFAESEAASARAEGSSLFVRLSAGLAELLGHNEAVGVYEDELAGLFLGRRV